MSYHNTSRGGTGSNARRSTTTPTPARQNITNTQRQAAPAGFHYMPDGTLMSDADHAALYSPGSNGGLMQPNNQRLEKEKKLQREEMDRKFVLETERCIREYNNRIEHNQLLYKQRMKNEQIYYVICIFFVFFLFITSF